MTVDASAVRSWARQQGIAVAERGRLSASLVEQYLAAGAGGGSASADEPAAASGKGRSGRGRRGPSRSGKAAQIAELAPPAPEPVAAAAGRGRGVDSAASAARRSPRRGAAGAADGQRSLETAGAAASGGVDWERVRSLAHVAGRTVVVAAAERGVGCSTVAALTAAAGAVGGPCVLLGDSAFTDLEAAGIVPSQRSGSQAAAALVVDAGVVEGDLVGLLGDVDATVVVVTTLARPVAQRATQLAAGLSGRGLQVALVVNQAFSGSGVSGQWLTQASAGAAVRGTIPADVPAVVRAVNEGAVSSLLRHRTVGPQAALLGSSLFEVAVSDLLGAWSGR